MNKPDNQKIEEGTAYLNFSITLHDPEAALGLHQLVADNPIQNDDPRFPDKVEIHLAESAQARLRVDLVMRDGAVGPSAILRLASTPPQPDAIEPQGPEGSVFTLGGFPVKCALWLTPQGVVATIYHREHGVVNVGHFAAPESVDEQLWEALGKRNERNGLKHPSKGDTEDDVKPGRLPKVLPHSASTETRGVIRALVDAPTGDNWCVGGDTITPLLTYSGTENVTITTNPVDVTKSWGLPADSEPLELLSGLPPGCVDLFVAVVALLIESGGYPCTIEAKDLVLFQGKDPRYPKEWKQAYEETFQNLKFLEATTITSIRRGSFIIEETGEKSPVAFDKASILHILRRLTIQPELNGAEAPHLYQIGPGGYILDLLKYHDAPQLIGNLLPILQLKNKKHTNVLARYYVFRWMEHGRINAKNGSEISITRRTLGQYLPPEFRHEHCYERLGKNKARLLKYDEGALNCLKQKGYIGEILTPPFRPSKWGGDWIDDFLNEPLVLTAGPLLAPDIDAVSARRQVALSKLGTRRPRSLSQK